MIRRCFLAALATGAIPLAFAAAQGAAPAQVQVQDAWSRATPPHAATGVVYFTLTSPVADRLTGISSPLAASASVHVTQRDGDVMRMRPVTGGLELAPGRPVTLAPGGTHVMLEGLKAALVAGGKVPLRLTFQNAPPVDIEAEIRAPGRPSGTMEAMPGMPMER